MKDKRQRITMSWPYMLAAAATGGAPHLYPYLINHAAASPASPSVYPSPYGYPLPSAAAYASAALYPSYPHVFYQNNPHVTSYCSNAGMQRAAAAGGAMTASAAGAMAATRDITSMTQHHDGLDVITPSSASSSQKLPQLTDVFPPFFIGSASDLSRPAVSTGDSVMYRVDGGSMTSQGLTSHRQPMGVEQQSSDKTTWSFGGRLSDIYRVPAPHSE